MIEVNCLDISFHQILLSPLILKLITSFFSFFFLPSLTPISHPKFKTFMKEEREDVEYVK